MRQRFDWWLSNNLCWKHTLDVNVKIYDYLINVSGVNYQDQNSYLSFEFNCYTGSFNLMNQFFEDFEHYFMHNSFATHIVVT